MTSVFHVKDLRFGYTSVSVLQGLSTELGAGEFVTLIGPNGAGKSTLLKIMAGLIRGYSGAVDFSGKALSLWGARELARRIAFVPQETHMVFPFTAVEIVMMGRLPHRTGLVFDGPRDTEWAREAMTLTDTAD